MESIVNYMEPRDIYDKIGTNASELSLFTTKALRIYMAVVGLFGIQIACQMTFVALGNAKASVIVAVTRKLIYMWFD